MDNWLPTLITPAPTEGYNLVVGLSRVANKRIQHDFVVCDRVRPENAEDAGALIAVSAVIASHFDGYWRNAG